MIKKSDTYRSFQILTFTSKEDQDIYLTHPTHLKIH